MRRDLDGAALRGIGQAWRIPLIVSVALAEEIRTGGPDVLDRFLLPMVDSLKKAYSQTGNPSAIIAAALGLVRGPFIEGRAHRGSLQLARLRHFVAELYLATGPRGGLAAVDHAQGAVDELGHIGRVTVGTRKLLVDSSLTWAVGQKMTGATDESHRTLRESTERALHGFAGSFVDVVPLVRQELMMRQTFVAHEALASQAPGYADVRPQEYYRTVKRIFEYLLNQDRLSQAERLLPEFRRAFRVVAPRSSPISHVSFQKNIGQYYARSGFTREAAGVLLRTYTSALTLGLGGQAAQVKALMEGLHEGGSELRLITANVSMGR